MGNLEAQKEKLGQENEKLDLKNRAEAQESSAGPKSLVDGEKAPLDLFKAVFQNSDSDQSESSDTHDGMLKLHKFSIKIRKVEQKLFGILTTMIQVDQNFIFSSFMDLNCLVMKFQKI